MASIELKAVTAATFAPFGLLLPTPALGQPRLELYGELANILRATAEAATDARDGAAPADAAADGDGNGAAHPIDADLRADSLRERYLATDALHGADDRPDSNGDEGISRSRRCRRPLFRQHLASPAHRAGKAGSFVVLTFIDGGPGDEQFVKLSGAIQIVD